MVKSIHGLSIFFLVVAMISSCEYNNDELLRVSLIVANIDDSSADGDRIQHLVTYEFDKGELISTETVVSNPGGQLRFNCEESQVYRNRYIITDFGDIVDITTRQFIHRGGSGSEYTRLLGIEGDYVYIHQPQTDKYYYYDLAKLEDREMEDPGKWSLPGLLSPDGTLSVSSSDRNEGQVWLHYLNGEIKLLGTGFYVEYSPLSSLLFGVPLMWLDNERILTQKSNGEIVILAVDGTMVPVVNIDLSDFDFAPVGSTGALNTHFYTDFNTDIIYYISMIGPEGKFRTNRFLIDVKNKTYSIYDPEWIGLGHQFEYSTREDNTVLRYNGDDIGQEQYFLARHVQTTEGHIATLSRESTEYPTSIRVWSSVNGKWTTMDFEFPIWITYSSIIGWLK